MTFRGLCAYCGLPTPRGPACVAHSDLPALDPFYSPARYLAEPLPARTRPARAAPT